MLPSTPSRRRGRPFAQHRTASGDNIIGLKKLKDGRWRISATGEVFSEADESLAVARFEAAIARQRSTVSLPLQANTVDQALSQAQEAGFARLRMHLAPGEHARYSVEVGSSAFYAIVRKLILEEPKTTARLTGIEQLAHLDLVSTESPRLSLLGNLYFTKPLSDNERSRSKLFWSEFMKATGAATASDVTHDTVARYEKWLLDRRPRLSPKSILHRHRKVRGIFHWALKRGQHPQDCRKALDALAMLEVKNAHPLDPTPITPAQFWAIHHQALEAKDATFAALLLTALNCAMYGGEVAALTWEEIDLQKGELVTRRPKTGISRIAVLWPQTVAALKALPHEGEMLFNTRVRSYTVFSVGDRFKRYRDAAKLPATLTFGTIRDASFTTACRVSLDQARMLAGQRCGVADHYLRRSPGLVKEACAAIAKEFAVARHV